MDNFASAVAEVSVAVAELTGETPTVYVTPHDLSQKIAGAFALGCDADIVQLPMPADNNYDFRRSSWEIVNSGLAPTGPIAVYGILRRCGEVIELARQMKHDYFHIDNGYVRQSRAVKINGVVGNLFDGYYRITKNGFQVAETEDRPSDRWDRLDIRIAKNWNRQGRNILVIPPSGFVSQYQGIDPGIWQTQVESEIRKRTDRPIRVKPFKGQLQEYLNDTYCLVTHESMAALHALIDGTPAMTLGRHCIGNLSWDWDNLDRPDYFDREAVNRLCWSLAYHQWSLTEMADGVAWGMLNETL